MRPSQRPRRPTCEDGACMHEYRRRVWAIPGARTCQICGFKLDPDTSANACDQPYCREELEERMTRARRQLELQASREAAALRKERELRELRPGEIPAEVLLTVLPGTNRAMAAQHPERRTLLRERLTGLMEDADADPEGPTGDPIAVEGPPGPGDLLTRGACTACRGHCCRLGEDHAFLRPATLRRFRKTHPEWTVVEVVDAYLARVPAVATEGSCVFHGREGCTLPRAMRSDVCNRYLCDDLERAHKAAAGSKAPILAVCIDGTTPLRTVLLDGALVRPIDETPPPAP
jgi:hypothetical protein